MSIPEVDVEKVERILENSQKTCVVLDELAYLLGILPKGSQEDPQWWKEKDAVCEKVRREALRSDCIEEFGGGLRYKDL